MASNVVTSSVLNVKAAQASGQLRRQPEPPKMPPSSDAPDPDAAVIAERLPESTLSVLTRNDRIEVMLNEPPAQIMAKIDPTISTIQQALHILGTNNVFTSKVVTLQLMMEMQEVVKQQPRDQRDAHWQRVLGYLSGYQLPELPRQGPPDPGDELRNVRKRGNETDDVNVLCRREQTVQVTDELTRSQERTDSVTEVWQNALEQTRLARQMPTRSAYASNVRSRDSSSQTTRTNCDSQMLRMHKGAGAPNLAEPSRRQRTNLQQADGRLQSHSQNMYQLYLSGLQVHQFSTIRNAFNCSNGAATTGSRLRKPATKTNRTSISEVSSHRAIRFEAQSKRTTTSP
jgi:hypothetical protein